MSQQFDYAFGRELVAMRQAEFEAKARHGTLVRMLKRARRADRVPAARVAHRDPAPVAPPAHACCAADLG